MEERRVDQEQSGFGTVQTRSTPALNPATVELLEQAWVVRQQRHSPVLTMVKPHQTLAVSVTGGHCDLQCRHCDGHYLRAMTPVGQALDTYLSRSFSSCLISGGCQSNGTVPVVQHEDVLLKLRKAGARLNCHVGVCDAPQAKRLSSLVDCVSFDLVGDDETLGEVYGVGHAVEKLWESFLRLSDEITTYPHICIGLRGGRISGEYAVLKRLEDMSLPAVVFLILIPTPNTAYAECAPPSLDEVARFLARARLQLPKVPLFLGCMRPAGRYRALVDELAVRAGIQKIVKPMPAAVRWAQRAGLDVRIQKECCVL